MAKFTKEQAIKELEAKIPAKDKELDLGRTIAEAVDNSLDLIGEDSEMELGEFVEKVYKQVKTSIGLTHSENSKVAQKMKKQLDELQEKIDGRETTPPKEASVEIKSDDPAIQAMLEKLTKMEEKLQRQERETTIGDKRAALKAKMSEDIKDKEWIDAYLKEINVTEETDVEAKAKDYVAFYNKTAAGGGRRSVTPRQTGGNDDPNDSYVKSTVAAAAQVKKTLSATRGGSPVHSTTVNNNN